MNARQGSGAEGGNRKLKWRMGREEGGIPIMNTSSQQGRGQKNHLLPRPECRAHHSRNSSYGASLAWGAGGEFAKVHQKVARLPASNLFGLTSAIFFVGYHRWVERHGLIPSLHCDVCGACPPPACLLTERMSPMGWLMDIGGGGGDLFQRFSIGHSLAAFACLGKRQDAPPQTGRCGRWWGGASHAGGMGSR